jgi:two-component system response regulator PilR (NtrC family)
MVERAKPAPLGASLLPAHLGRAPAAKPAIPTAGIDLSVEVEQFEVALLSEALKQCRGVQNKAAQLLGIKPTTLNMKLLRFGIDVSLFK